MEVLSRFTGERCGIDNCRSRRYHRADDGLVYCQNGHQSSATFETELENDYVEASQATTRAHRSSPQVSQASVFLDSREAAQTYLRCVQYVLQSQVKWVTRHLESTGKLEGIVKDLWTIQLQILEPSLLKAVAEHDTILFETQPRDGEMSAADSITSLPREFSLLDCCALIYLGCVSLRLPVAHRHIHDWINSDTFPFLTTAALLPPSLFAKLPLAYRRTFHVRTGAPGPGTLHKHTLRMAILHATSTFKIRYPPLNYHLILFHFLAALSLPLDLYPMALRIGECLGYEFKFPSSVQKHVSMADFPEIQVLCILVLAVKLAHPFDGATRSPRSDAETAALQIDWRQWTRARSREELTPIQRNEALFKTNEHDVSEMDGDQLDEYLDWYQTTWLNEQIEDKTTRADFRKQLGKMFPLQEQSQSRRGARERRQEANPLQDNVRAVQETLQRVPPIASPDGKVLRPGQDYVHYKKPTDLPANALPFFEAASRLGAVTVDQLTQAVFQTEMRAKNWQGQQA